MKAQELVDKLMGEMTRVERETGNVYGLFRQVELKPVLAVSIGPESGSVYLEF